MTSRGKVSQQIKLDERNHVEKPLLDQLTGLGWEVIDLGNRDVHKYITKYRLAFNRL